MRYGFLLLMLVAANVFAEPFINEKYIYYDVSPSSKGQILKVLNSATPIKAGGELFHGHTYSYITWNFWWDSVYGKCEITRVKVDVDITITLPRLGKAPGDVMVVWNQWYPNLVRHENNHKNNAIEIANKIEKGLYRLPGKSNCKQLENEANVLGNNFIVRLHEMDKAYDLKTGHGETEGASIHPYLKNKRDQL